MFIDNIAVSTFYPGRVSVVEMVGKFPCSWEKNVEGEPYKPLAWTQSNLS